MYKKNKGLGSFIESEIVKHKSGGSLITRLHNAATYHSGSFCMPSSLCSHFWWLGCHSFIRLVSSKKPVSNLLLPTCQWVMLVNRFLCFKEMLRSIRVSPVSTGVYADDNLFVFIHVPWILNMLLLQGHYIWWIDISLLFRASHWQWETYHRLCSDSGDLWCSVWNGWWVRICLFNSFFYHMEISTWKITANQELEDKHRMTFNFYWRLHIWNCHIC